MLCIEIATFFPADGKYFSYFDSNDTSSCLLALKNLETYLETDGPFDGILAFSQGGGLAATYLANLTRREEAAKGNATPAAATSTHHATTLLSHSDSGRASAAAATADGTAAGYADTAADVNGTAHLSHGGQVVNGVGLHHLQIGDSLVNGTNSNDGAIQTNTEVNGNVRTNVQVNGGIQQTNGEVNENQTDTPPNNDSCPALTTSSPPTPTYPIKLAIFLSSTSAVSVPSLHQNHLTFLTTSPSHEINLPTLHIYGTSDPRLNHSISVSQLCKEATVLTHPGGHEVPGVSSKKEATRIVHAVRRMVGKVEAVENRRGGGGM